jgi:hypothetical protein
MRIFLLSGALLGAPAALLAEVLSVADFDSDSYLFLGTNNHLDPYLTLNPHTSEESHFNFGVIEFPLGTVPDSGRKFLAVHLPFFVTGSIETGFGTSDTGEAEVAVVALGDDYATYLNPSVSKRGWYDLYLHGQPVLGTFTFKAEKGEGLGWYYLEVTATVDAWLADPSSAHGFGLYAISGSVDLNASDGPEETAPRLVDRRPLTYAEWKMQHFVEADRDAPGLSGWGADPDADGRSNGWEYHQGTDPRKAEAESWGIVTRREEGVFWTAPFRRDRADGALVIEVSRDWQTWEEPVEDGWEVVDGRAEVELSDDGAQAVRLRLVNP